MVEDVRLDPFVSIPRHCIGETVDFQRQASGTRLELPYVDFTVDCSKGTYVRTLCADIGAKLGCGGVLHALRSRSY